MDLSCLDFIESPKSQWMGRYNWGDENQSTQGINRAGSKIVTNYEQYTGSNTRTITPNLVNDARFGYSRFFNSLGTLSAFSNSRRRDRHTGPESRRSGHLGNSEHRL